MDWMDFPDDPRDDHRPCATEAEAHVEWHINSGVPMGQPCPWDACDPAFDYEPPEETYWEHEMREDPPDEEPEDPAVIAEIRAEHLGFSFGQIAEGQHLPYADFEFDPGDLPF